jgi:hypothetical protein
MNPDSLELEVSEVNGGSRGGKSCKEELTLGRLGKHGLVRDDVLRDQLEPCAMAASNGSQIQYCSHSIP